MKNPCLARTHDLPVPRMTARLRLGNRTLCPTLGVKTVTTHNVGSVTP